MKLMDFIQALLDAGWKSANDAQWTEIEKLHARLFPTISTLEKELGDANETIAELWAKTTSK